MRGFPQQVGGPMGPWYQRVNATIRKAQTSGNVDQLREVLGEPDQIEMVANDDRRESEDAPIDERYPAEFWIYIDPYRRRIQYRFGISEDRIVEISKVTHTA